MTVIPAFRVYIKVGADLLRIALESGRSYADAQRFTATVREAVTLSGTMIAVKPIATRPKVGRDGKSGGTYGSAGLHHRGRVDRNPVRRNSES
jgi:hypothetical protein